MKKLLFLLSIVVTRQIHGQTYVTIPDANFVTYLQSLIPSAMNGNQMNTSSPLVTTTTHLINVQATTISDLNGVQYFSSLDTLLCGQTVITTLPTLPNSITYLETNFCFHLTSLPALPTSLTTMYCSNTVLTSLPSLPNSLSILYCANNNITCFPPFPNSITQIGITGNPYNCLPNYILPAMNTYTTTPLCAAGNSNGCPVANSIEQFHSNIQVTVYPNPTSDQFYIETNATDKLTVDLYDVNGRHVFNKSVSDKSNISVATLDNGIYTLTIKTADRVTNKKLVIVH